MARELRPQSLMDRMWSGIGLNRMLSPVTSLVPLFVPTLNSTFVVSYGVDGQLRVWDGLLGTLLHTQSCESLDWQNIPDTIRTSAFLL